MLYELISRIASQVGFDVVGITPALAPSTSGAYRRWLAAGCHGQMNYLERLDAVAKRASPELIMPGLHSIMSVGLNYHSHPPPPELALDPSRGLIASYAWGHDYHDLMLPRLRRMGQLLQAQTDSAITWSAYVDTGPILEREWAARCGLGFIGKNTSLIHPRFGSWLLLGELLLSFDPSSAAVSPGAADRLTLAPRFRGRPAETVPPEQAPLLRMGTCGNCARCLDACPTGALVSPYTLDSRLCIAYLTIEHRGPISRELRPLLGNRIFGCDICQDVCPWNRRFSRPTRESLLQAPPSMQAPSLVDILALTPDAFLDRFRGSPLLRSKRQGLLRNAAIALGNWREPTTVPVVASVLQDPDALVRGHAAWALGQIGSHEARSALEGALPLESDDWVLSEIDAALRQL